MLDGRGRVGCSALVAGLRLVDLLLERDRSEVVVQLGLLLVPHLLLELLLVEDGLLGLLEGLLDARLHPVSVVTCWLYVQVVKLLVDVLPDLAILQERVQLDDLHDLLFACVELMKVEADPVESAKDGRSQVVVLDNLVEDVADVGLVVLVSTLAHVACGLQSHPEDARGLRS